MSEYGDHDGHHGSASPIIMSAGLPFLLLGIALVNIVLIVGGVTIFVAGLINWWREDIDWNGTLEPKSIGQPFGGIDIRKVGMWIFLMSETMVFSSLFSTYIRYRTNMPSIYECTPADLPYCWIPASHFIAADWGTLAPGAINTFALIISSYTLVLALNAAKLGKQRKTTMYLSITLGLGIMFLILKMIEWNTLIFAEGYRLNGSNWKGHDHFCHGISEAICSGHGTERHWVDGLGGVDLRLSASTFYVTTGTHGAHVFAGLIGLLYLIIKSANGGWDKLNAQGIEYFALYWHFVDLAWVVVFPAFYLY